jgi:hypothetical protein
VDVRPGEHVAFKVSGLDQYGQPYPIEDMKWSAAGCSISAEGVLIASESAGRYIVEVRAGGFKADAPVHVLAAEEKPEEEGRQPAIRWSGVVPPRKWTTFYTKVIAKLASAPGLTVRVTFEVPAGDQTTSKINELKSSLRDLGLERRKIIREWMTLPKDKRQTAEQAAVFAKKAVQQNEFHRSRRDPDQKFRRDLFEKVIGWLLPRAGKS